MSVVVVAEVSAGDFKASASHDGARVVARCAGNADLRAGEALDRLLAAIDAEAQRLQVPEVAVDLRDLEFMNASCFKRFVTWIGRIQEQAPRRQYKIRFLSNPKFRWQERSLQALRCFALELITIEA